MVHSSETGRRSGGGTLGSVVVCLLIALLAGCGSDEFPDRTARVDIGGRTTTFALDACGLDASTLFVVGRSDGGETLQAVVGVGEAGSGVLASTGLTVSDEGNDLAAFGPESWERRSGAGPAPGRITSARLRGSRIQVAGEMNTVTEASGGAATPPEIGAQDITFSLDARCDDQSS